MRSQQFQKLRKAFGDAASVELLTQRCHNCSRTHPLTNRIAARVEM
jgi:hypothetical protein